MNLNGQTRRYRIVLQKELEALEKKGRGDPNTYIPR
jgi:hypothetical protein